MRVLRRHRIVVPVEADQRQRIGLAGLHAPRLEGLCGQRQHRPAVFLQEFRLGPFLPAKLDAGVPAGKSSAKPSLNTSKSSNSGTGTRKFRRAITDEAFRTCPFSIRPADQAEVMLKQVMALQPQELPREHAAPLLNHLRHGDLRVVVADPLRHGAEELEGPTMALLKRLGAFPGKDLAEEGVAERQRHHEHRHLPLLPAIDDRRLAEIGLGFARPMRQRHEDFRRPPLPAAHLFLDDGSAAAIPLLAEPLQNPLGRVPLFLRGLLVGFENLVDQRHERPQDRLFARLLLPIAGRFLMLQNLLQRVPMQAVLLAGLTLRQFAGQHPATHFAPQFHVRVHSRLPRGGVRLVAVIPLQALLTLPRVRFKSATFFDRYAGPVPRHAFQPAFTGRNTRGEKVEVETKRPRCPVKNTDVADWFPISRPDHGWIARTTSTTGSLRFSKTPMLRPSISGTSSRTQRKLGWQR